MNDNQNHRIRQGWTSSRVHAPPGGAGNLTLGMAAPKVAQPPVVAKENNGAQKEDAKPEKEEEKPQIETLASPTSTTPTPASTPTTASTSTSTTTHGILPGLGAPSQPVSANAFASGANMNGAQVMTGRSTSRVRQPGGMGGPDSGWKLG